MRIAYAPADPDAPGSYRCLFPMEQMAKRGGHDARVWPHKFDLGRNVGIIEYDMTFKPSAADIAVLHLPQQKVWLQWALAARLEGKVVIGDTDDDFINLTPDHPAYDGTSGDPRRGGHPDFNRFWMIQVFMACDALTVTTPHLKRVYEQINPNVHVLPNALNWDMWEDVTPQYEVDRERVRIGWVGSAHWRPRDIELFAQILLPFLRDHPEVDMVLAGDNRKVRHLFPRERLIYIDGVQFRKRPGMTDLSPYPKVIAQMDIGLVPLQLTPFNESKSCLKGMEYAACGIPCVASPTEVYRDWLSDGQAGLLATDNTPEQFRHHLETLLDPVVRRKMGEAARRKAKAHSIQRKWRKWAETYLSIKHSRVPYMPGQYAAQVAASNPTPTSAARVAA